MDKSRSVNALREQLEKLKSSIRAKVEHPFRVIKCQFGHRKVRYWGLAKNTSQQLVMFALSNLWLVPNEFCRGCSMGKGAKRQSRQPENQKSVAN